MCLNSPPSLPALPRLAGSRYYQGSVDQSDPASSLPVAFREDMDIPPLYLTASAAWFSIQAVPLAITPKLILSLLSPDEQRATDTEIYLSRIVALCLFTLALVSVFVPAGYISLLLTLFHVATFIYIYTVYLFLSSSLPSYTPGGILSSTPNTTGLILGLIGYGLLSILGIWVLVFGTVPSHLSKRTGADKRTSGFPFKNAEAYNKKRDYAAAAGDKAR